jgi:hypothetical protein
MSPLLALATIGSAYTNKNVPINVALLMAAKASRGGIMMAQNIERFCQKNFASVNEP